MAGRSPGEATAVLRDEKKGPWSGVWEAVEGAKQIGLAIRGAENVVLAMSGHTISGGCRNSGIFVAWRCNALLLMRCLVAVSRATGRRAGWQSGSWSRCRTEGKRWLAFL